MTQDSPKLSQFWQELKRRNVVRVITVYAGAAFVILEASDLIFPRLGFPDWTVDVVLYLLIAGFVVAAIVSWIFDITPEGVEKTPPVAEGETEVRPGVAYGWKISTYVSLIIVAGFIIYHLADRVRISRQGEIQSLVVLPFDNFTGNDELEYFVSGMHASLIGDLGKINGLRIISKTTAKNLNSAEMSIPEIADELKVDAVIETMVTCIGDSICVQFRLIGARQKEQLLWAGTYEVDQRDVLNLNNWVISDLATKIELPLSSEQQTELNVPRPVNPDAYELYLKGKFNMGFLTREGQQAALEYFGQALAMDPGFAEAHAGIANVWGILKQMDYVSPDEANPEIEKNITRALELDSEDEEVLYYNGVIKIWKDFDYDAGERSLRQCLEINPNYSEAWAYLSHLMMALKKPAEMKEYMEKAQGIDPRNPLIQVLATVELMVSEEYEQCILKATQLQSLMPNNPLLMLDLFICYAETGNYDKAIPELNKVFSQLANEEVIKVLNEEYHSAGFKSAMNAAADAWIEGSEFVSAQHATMLYAYGENEDNMFYWLDRAYIRRDPSNPYLGVLPYLRRYADHPRYLEILQRMNLPTGPFPSPV
jgi:adenylate cyclase